MLLLLIAREIMSLSSIKQTIRFQTTKYDKSFQLLRNRVWDYNIIDVQSVMQFVLGGYPYIVAVLIRVSVKRSHTKLYNEQINYFHQNSKPFFHSIFFRPYSVIKILFHSVPRYGIYCFTPVTTLCVCVCARVCVCVRVMAM